MFVVNSPGYLAKVPNVNFIIASLFGADIVPEEEKLVFEPKVATTWLFPVCLITPSSLNPKVLSVICLSDVGNAVDPVGSILTKKLVLEVFVV